MVKARRRRRVLCVSNPQFRPVPLLLPRSRKKHRMKTRSGLRFPLSYAVRQTKTLEKTTD